MANRKHGTVDEIACRALVFVVAMSDAYVLHFSVASCIVVNARVC